MNIFEFSYKKFILEEFKIFPKKNVPKPINLVDFLKSKNINTNFDSETSEISIWEFYCNQDFIIIGFQAEINKHQHFFIKLCQIDYDENNKFELLNDCIDISNLLAINGIEVKSISSCYKIQNSDILIMFISSNEFNNLIRYNILLNNITDIQSFPINSYFESRFSKFSNELDFVINPNESITAVLINQSNNEEKEVVSYPSISDLKSVLEASDIMAVQVLFDIWLTNITNLLSENIDNSLDIIYNGVSVGKYLNFLYIHMTTMFDIIWNHCEFDNSSTSMGNRFVEQLSSLANHCINEAINILSEFGIKLGTDIFQLKRNHIEINRVFNVLCENGNRFRKLVLASRWSLSAFKKISLVSKHKDFKEPEKSLDNSNRWDTMEKEKIIKEGLLTGQIASIQLYFKSNSQKTLTEKDLTDQIKQIILSNVEEMPWNNLMESIKKLGYEPVQTLTSLCLETDVRTIRNVIFTKLNLEKQNPKYLLAKNMIDELETSFNDIFNKQKLIITSAPEEKSNLFSYIQPFIKQLEKSESVPLKNTLAGTVNQMDNNQPIRLKLNWLMEYYEYSTKDTDYQDIKNIVDTCLIDIDYQKLQSVFVSSENYQGHLKNWLVKWKAKNELLLVNYLSASNNIEFMVDVLELSFKINSTKMIDKVIIQLFSIINSNLDKHDDQSKIEFTLIDCYFAKNVLLFLLINKPNLFIYKLIDWCQNNLSKASELIFNINSTFPVHYMCTDSQCKINQLKISDSKLLPFINHDMISRIISSQIMDEFPIFLHFILKDSGVLPINLCPENDYVLKSTFHFHSAMKTKSQIELFQSLLSEKVFGIQERNYSMSELDEILYAALFAGISINEITNSENDKILLINKILTDNDYWNLLRKRLLRPQIKSDEPSNKEQYYDVNLYNFLHRCGIPLNLIESFSWQPQNQFAIDLKIRQIPTISCLVKKHQSLFETSNYSLDYVYYLSLGRPFQAFMSIITEFSDVRKPNTIAQDILKDIERSIHQIALSNIYDEKIVGSCFGLFRLIGLNPESLRCYLTLVKWIIDWHVTSIEQANLSESSGSQSNSDDTRRYYEVEIGKMFKLCLSKISTGKKPIRKKLLKQIEDIFIYKVKNNIFTEISDVLESWSLVLYFCQLQSLEFSTELLQYYAKENEWLLFLCCAQIFGYTKDQVKLGINKFKDICIRQHMSYIASKVVDFNTSLVSKREDSIQKSKRFSHGAILTKAMGLVPPDIVTTDIGNKLNCLNAKDNSKPLKKSNKLCRSTLQKAAKNSLIELIFDCQVNQNVKGTSDNDFTPISQIQLNNMKLLAFSLVLNHPFLSVLAFCSEQYNNNTIENTEMNFSSYFNYISCFILSSFPERILKEFWIKWDDVIKIEWTEDETVELIKYAIKNKFTNIVADAFFIFQPEKYNCVSSFFFMITQAVDIWNPVQRESFFADFIQKCSLIGERHIYLRDKHRNKLNKDNQLLFFNRILETGLIVSLNTIQNNLGSRFVYDWLQCLSSSKSGLNNVYVKQLFVFNDINMNLLIEVFTVFHDYIDFNTDFDSTFGKTVIPINVKTKDFIDFIEIFISTLVSSASNSIGYSQLRIISDISRLINTIITEAHTSGFLRDKMEMFKSLLSSLESKFAMTNVQTENSIVDLVSMAFVGQYDKEDIVEMCSVKIQDNSVDDNDVLIMPITNIPPKINYGKTNSWRRLVIPEDWQDQIFTISESGSNNTLESISHVNSLLNEKKWIEACSYMIENDVYVKDAVYILVAMKIACGMMDPNQWPTYTKGKESSQKPSVRRRSIYTNSTTKLKALASFDIDSHVKSSRKVNRDSQACQNFLRNMLEIVCHGQVIVEYIYTINCVANKMTESYLTIAKGEEFDVFTKILIGTCREKIDTADMYLGVVDIDLDRLSRFLADVIVQVLRSELQTHLASSTTSIPTSIKKSSLSSPNNTGNSKDICFTISPTSDDASKLSPPLKSNKTSNMQISNTVFQDYVSKVAQRCQLRTELNTSSPELRLMKAFYLQDLLILTSCYRRLGEILYDYYQHFSQEVFSCKDDAEFLVLMLIQCHNCFTEAGDTVGISHCLKSAKELSKALTSQSYFVLLAQLLCRVGRYGEMPYIFTALIENEHFELLLRKDMDREGVIVPYVLDYLSRYSSGDFEKIELVCLKYNCFYELAETKSKKANHLIKKLKSHSWKNTSKDSIKSNLVPIISNLLESCKNYFKVGCYKKMKENFRKSQLYRLQYKWIEDPDKLFAVNFISTPLNKSLKNIPNKRTFPTTVFSGGMRIIDMNLEEALHFLQRVPNFYTAYIIIDQLKLSSDLWTELIIHHVLQNGDEVYLSYYIHYFGRVLSPNLIQQCSNRLDNLPTKQISKQFLNLKLLIRYCNDVFLVKRLSDKYQLNK